LPPQKERRSIAERGGSRHLLCVQGEANQGKVSTSWKKIGAAEKTGAGERLLRACLKGKTFRREEGGIVRSRRQKGGERFGKERKKREQIFLKTSRKKREKPTSVSGAISGGKETLTRKPKKKGQRAHSISPKDKVVL